MTMAPAGIFQDYWNQFEVTKQDIDFLSNHLFELETPLDTKQLLSALILERITVEQERQEKAQKGSGRQYLPKDSYSIGEDLAFPTLNWKKGKVKSIRTGNNPEIGDFKVIEVDFAQEPARFFAAELVDHTLNDPKPVEVNVEANDPAVIIKESEGTLEEKLEAALEADANLVKIAGAWFPKALLVDINPGHLNLAEAVLEMNNGGPLPTTTLMEQLELPDSVNCKLVEFSLNGSLQADPRFDEVGASGEVLWFLEQLEPENVRNTPQFLQYQPLTVDRSAFTREMIALEREIDDELSPEEKTKATDQVNVILTYPHWRAGTLPLSSRMSPLFPTAFESPRIKFEFLDQEGRKTIPGWVVRPRGYVVGLRDWYIDQGIMPGSVLTIHKANPNGQVVINPNRHRSKEWFRTVLVGADGGIVLALLKQQVNTQYDERMTIFIPDSDALDLVWNQKNRSSIEDIILHFCRELMKLSPQGHVHAQELYAAVNIARRCPPQVIFHVLSHHPAVKHIGDLYYRLEE